MSGIEFFLIAISPFIGSFISATANCWPNWNKVLQTRSGCSSCHSRLILRDLIPIISFLSLAGKCRNCAKSIPSTHLLAEIVSLLIAIVSVLVFSTWLALITALLGWVLLFGALVDLRTKLLPNEMTYSLLIAGLLLAGWRGGSEGLFTAMLGAIIGYGVFFLIAKAYKFFRGREGLGLGDAKLLAAGGAWVGPFALSWIVLLACCFAIIGLLVGNAIKQQPTKANTIISFGPALATAIFLIWLWQGTSLYLL